ncbi:MAG TPA: hypothetical protein VNF00_06225 [Candidatus Acidoferrales bacterium]|nr:hypothetical protein [Candidatus Acidoferrales bacterium]
MLEGAPQVSEPWPKHGGAEQDGHEFTSRGDTELPQRVRSVAIAEAIFEGHALASLAEMPQM